MKRLVTCSLKSRIYIDIPDEIKALLNQTYGLHDTFSELDSSNST